MATVRVDEGLLRAMRREGVLLLLRRPSTLSFLIACPSIGVGALLLFAVGTALGSPPERDTVLVVVVCTGVLLLVAALHPLLYDRLLHGVLKNGYPIGTPVTASVQADRLRVEDATGTLEQRLSMYRRVRVAPSVVLLEQRSAAFLLVPRAALSDADVEHLVAAVGSTAVPAQ